jgi:uncharacterized membrane protein YeiH
LTHTIPVPLHQLPAWIDVTAMAVGGAVGAHVAGRRNAPLFAVLFAGMVGGLSGGIARDVLLGLEPTPVTTWYYVPAIFIAVVTGGLGGRWVKVNPLPFVAAEATAVALLTTIGVQKAVVYQAPGPSAILIGVVAATTGAAGVDLLTDRSVALLAAGPWLLGLIVCGSVIFWVLTICMAFYVAVAVTVALVVSFRVLSVRLGWSTVYFPGEGQRSPGQ